MVARQSRGKTPIDSDAEADLLHAPRIRADQIDEQIDEYIAQQYMAMRAGNLDSFTARILAMGEEAESLGKGGDKAVTQGLRALAKWELEQA